MEAEQRAAQERIDAERRVVEAERKRLADAEAARQRAAEIEQARIEAAERAKRETEARIAREALEAKQREEAAEATRKRAEALRPDREKLLAVADAVLAVQVPQVSPEASRAAAKVADVLASAVGQIRAIAGALAG
jgi:hypothetical protein